MEAIHRGRGTNDSERYLGRLADTTFLDLWTYPNVHIDKRSSPSGTGKELCDILVICGDDVIIFSDKSAAWKQTGNINLDWSRWYRRAVEKSVDQIRGAERWLRDFPDRIFLDPKCTKKLPIELPPVERRRVRGVAVALGAQRACSEYYNDDDGSLLIKTSLSGIAHSNPRASEEPLFAFGDVEPTGSFVHVLDETALNLIMREMDTVTDFVNYLDRREGVIRNQTLFMALSEADLIANYIASGNSFRDMRRGRKVIIESGAYFDLITGEFYEQRKIFNQISYMWDKLIRVFTENILAGTSVSVFEEYPTAALSEPALRIMARETRSTRRELGMAFVDALRTAERLAKDRFARVVLPDPKRTDPHCAYVMMILAYPTDVDLKEGYDQYRKARVSMLETYCYSVAQDYNNVKRVIGIAMDASSRVTGRAGGSEDLIGIEIGEWTPELVQDVSERRKLYNILERKNVRTAVLSHGLTAHADVKANNQTRGSNRQQRRAAERKAAKASR